MFYSGNRFPKDFRIAFDWFKKGADAGDRDSLYALGLMTLWGQGVKKNTKEAFDIFHKLIEVDYPLAIKIFYNHLDSPSAKEIAERFEHLEKEALAGDDDAQCELGGMYLIGEGAPKAELMAYEWLGLAAFKGHSKAQHDLAVMCRDGLGIGFDYKKSVFWFKKLAENGSDVDQDALGWLYLDLGESKKALKWCKKAAKHGNLDAMYHVALIYLLDEGIPRDAEKAAIELEKAASKGHLRSQVALTELREKAIIK
jgi:TPR repeat protein